MSIFFEVATLNEPQDGNYYAVLKIDTEKRVGDGCEAVVVSMHSTYPEAESARAEPRPLDEASHGR